MNPVRCAAALLAAAAFLHGSAAQELTSTHREAFAKCRKLQAEGNWLGAREVVRQLVDQFREAPPSQHRLAFANELANLDQRLGDYSDALAGYEECLETAAAVAGAESTIVAQLKNNLASLHQVLGNFHQAEMLNREALALREKIDGKGAVGTVPAMNNLAVLFWCIGDLGAAESLYREALAIRSAALGERALDTARSKANLGGLLFYRDEPEEAETLLREAVAVFELESGPDHPDTLEAVLFLGDVERALGGHESALGLYIRVAEGRTAAFGSEAHVEIGEARRRIGDALRSLGRYGEAIQSYRRSDEIYRQVVREAHPDRIEGLYGLGLAAIFDGAESVAADAADTCASIEFDGFEAILEFTDERQRLAYQDMFRSRHLYANLGNAGAVAEFNLRFKGIVIDSLIAEARLMKESEDPDIATAIRELSSARAAFRSAFLAGGNGTGEIPQLQAQVRERRNALLKLTGSRITFPELTDLRLDNLHQSIAPGEVLLDYVRFDRYRGKADFEERYGVAVVTSDRVEFFDCASAKEVDAVVAEIVPFFTNLVPDDAIARAAMQRLYRLLIDPVQAVIDANESAVICPESAVNFVPFACLMDEQGQFLIEKVDVSYVSSPREMERRQSPATPANGALLVGNPAFSTGESSSATVSDRRGFLAAFGTATLGQISESLTPLDGADREVDELARVVEDNGISPLVVKGIDATELLLSSRISRPYILHLATHGLYLPAYLPPPSGRQTEHPYVPADVAGFDNPMFGSWLALAGARETLVAWSEGTVPNPSDDGILMANEAAELDLNGTLIVTLSACETASGEATSGDGVLGLRRGFHLAGAENVLTTLWPISDAVTVDIMRQFYSQLSRTTPALSMSETQREWLVKIRDDPQAVEAAAADGEMLKFGGLYWAINFAGPFLLSR